VFTEAGDNLSLEIELHDVAAGKIVRYKLSELVVETGPESYDVEGEAPDYPDDGTLLSP
jgi:hypothetical protein